MNSRRVMNIDRVARAMTAGAPRSGFTARVMAPIHGRPRPDFTKRVMDAVAQDFSPAAVQGFSPARRALILIPAALALIAGVVAMRGARTTSVLAPPAPQLVTARPDAPVIVARPVTGEAPRKQHRPPRQQPAGPVEAPPIYTIAALEGPADLSMKSIEPGLCTVPALSGPPPLKVTDLPVNTGGSRDQEFTEKP